MAPPPEVAAALGSMSFPNIYPDPEQRTLRAALAEREGVPAEHLLVGCGADELLDLIIRCVLEPGEAILDCPPTFTMYAFDADVNDAKVITVPRHADFSLDMPAVLDAIRAQKPKVVFVTSPNNPDGSLIAEADLLTLLGEDVLVVLDEAYIEFAGEPSRAAWVMKYDNLIVLRTFSKSAALAGIRVGYGAFPLSLIEYMWRAKQPYNVSVAAEVAAVAALSNPTYLDTVRDALVAERGVLFQRIADEISFLDPAPSHANFVLCRVVGDQITGQQIRDRLAQEHGVMVRYYDKPLLRGFVRISVGKPEQTVRLIDALKQLV